MGKTVVVRPDGSKLEVDDADVGTLEKAGYRREQHEELVQRTEAASKERFYSSTSERIKTAIEGAGSGITLGLTDVIRREFASEEANRESDARREINPRTHTAGEFAGAVVGTLASGGTGLAASTPVGLLERAGTAVRGAVPGRAAGLAAEGALYGVGGAVEAANVSGDPLTIEGALEGAGFGAVLNYGFGRVGDVLIGKASKARQAIEAEKVAEKAYQEAAVQGAKLVDPPPSWSAFRDTHAGLADSVRAENRVHAREVEQYTKASTPDGVRSLVAQYKAARNEIQARIQATPHAQADKAGRRAATTADRVYTKAQAKVDEFVNSTEKFPQALEDFEEAINDFAARKGVDGAGSLEDQLKASLEEMQKNGGKLPDVKNSDDATNVREFKAQLSRAHKLKSGGFRVDGGTWVPDESVAPDPMGALRELHDLRTKLTTKYSKNWAPDLPKIPEKPADYVTPELTDDVVALQRGARDLDASINQALADLKVDGGASLATLRAGQARLHSIPGLEDLKLPAIPAPPRPRRETIEAIPKSLRDFARINEDRARRLAQQVDAHPELASTFDNLMVDLGTPPMGATPGERLLSGWAGLRGNLETLERLSMETTKASVKKKGPTGWLDMLRSKAKRGFAWGVGRTASTGGITGSVAQTVVGGAVGYAMGGAEGALITGSIFGAKGAARGKLRALSAKLGTPGRMVTKLGPVTAYLGASILTGDEDPETDPRKQSVNRITDALHGQYSAADSMYMAFEPLAGAPGDIMFKFHQHAVNAMNHLAEVAPKDPGIDVTPRGSDWTPDWSEAVKYAHRIEAVVNPLDAIERSISGDGHPAAAETLWVVWPALMQEAAQEVVAVAATRGLTYEEGSNLSQLFRVPLTGLQDQAVIVALQGQYLPKPEQPQSGAGKSKSPGGRPPAVNSPVAGSSVAALIS